jgi:hypothetical protein
LRIERKGPAHEIGRGLLFKLIKMGLSQCEKLGFELFFGNVGTDDLIFHFTVFEKQEQRDGFYAVFHSKAAGFIYIDLGDFCLTFDLGGELLEDGTDHFARTAPSCPEIDENREIGIDHFGLEIFFGKVKSHARNLKPASPFVKGGKEKTSVEVWVTN